MTRPVRPMSAAGSRTTHLFGHRVKWSDLSAIIESVMPTFTTADLRDAISESLPQLGWHATKEAAHRTIIRYKNQGRIKFDGEKWRST